MTLTAAPTTVTIDEDIALAVAGAIDQLKPEIAAAIADGLRTNNAVPVGDLGGMTLRTGTVDAVYADGHCDIILDGDGAETTPCTLLNGATIGQRVAVVFSPPSGALVLGTFGAVSGGGTPPTGALLGSVPNTVTATTSLVAYGGTVPRWEVRATNGSEGAPSATVAGNELGAYQFGGYGTTGALSGLAQIRAFAAENHSDTAGGTYVVMEVTPIGAVAPVESQRWNANGSVAFASSVAATGPAGTGIAYIANTYGGGVNLPATIDFRTTRGTSISSLAAMHADDVLGGAHVGATSDTVFNDIANFFCAADQAYSGVATIGATPVGAYTGVSANRSTDTFTKAGHTLVNGTPVILAGLSGNMTGVTSGPYYFVVNTNTGAGTFQLEATLGGGAINLAGTADDTGIIVSGGAWGSRWDFYTIQNNTGYKRVVASIASAGHIVGYYGALIAGTTTLQNLGVLGNSIFTGPVDFTLSTVTGLTGSLVLKSVDLPNDRPMTYAERAVNIALANRGSAIVTEVLLADSFDSLGPSNAEQTAFAAVYEKMMAHNFNFAERGSGFMNVRMKSVGTPITGNPDVGVKWDTITGTPVERGFSFSSTSLTTVTTRSSSANGTTNSTTTITTATAYFISADVGRKITSTGTDIPAGTYIVSVATDGLSAVISAAATGSHGSLTFTVAGAYAEVTRGGDGVTVYWTKSQTVPGDLAISINGKVVGVVSAYDASLPVSPGFDTGYSAYYANPDGYGSMEVKVTCYNGTAQFDGGYIHVRNGTSGYRLLRFTRPGWRINGSVSDPRGHLYGATSGGRWLDGANPDALQAIKHLQPQIVTVALGVNDANQGVGGNAETAAQLATNVQHMIAAIRAQYNTRTVTDGVTTSGSTTVTSATAAFVTDDIGAEIASQNLLPGTKIASINSGTSVEVTNAAEADDGSGQTLGIAPPPAIRYVFQWECNITPTLDAPADPEDWLTDYRTAIKNVIRTDGDVLFIDMSDALGSVFQTRDRHGLAADNIHPGDEASYTFGQLLATATIPRNPTPNLALRIDGGSANVQKSTALGGDIGIYQDNAGPNLHLVRGGSSTTLLNGGSLLGAITFGGLVAAGTYVDAAQMRAVVDLPGASLWTSSSAPTRIEWQTITAGVIFPDVKLILSNDGTLSAGTGWTVADPTTANWSITEAGDAKFTSITLASYIAKSAVLPAFVMWRNDGSGAVGLNASLGSVTWRGAYDATAGHFYAGGAIQVLADEGFDLTGTKSGSRMIFQTSALGGGGTVTTRGGFDSAGLFWVGTTVASLVASISTTGAIVTKGSITVGTTGQFVVSNTGALTSTGGININAGNFVVTASTGAVVTLGSITAGLAGQFVVSNVGALTTISLATFGSTGQTTIAATGAFTTSAAIVGTSTTALGSAGQFTVAANGATATTGSLTVGTTGQFVVSNTGAMTSSGGININSGNFVVTASNGNTVVLGTLAVGSTGQFTVSAVGAVVTTGSITVGTTGQLVISNVGAITTTGGININSGNFIVLGASGNTTVAGTLDVTGVTTLTGALVGVPVANSITVVGSTIGITGIVQNVNNSTAGPLTLTSAPTIANGVSGQVLILIGTGTQNVLVQDQGTLANSNLRLGATSRTIGPRDMLMLMFSTSTNDWHEIAFSNVL